MAEEYRGRSVVTSCAWGDLHATSLSSNWNNTNIAWHRPNPNSSSSCEEDLSVSSTSFTNASNHSSLTVESFLPAAAASSTDLIVDHHPSDTHIWNHVLLGGSDGELKSSQDVGENFLGAISSKSMSSGIFDQPACSDYLKKLDNTSNWDYNVPPISPNTLGKDLNGFSDHTITSNNDYHERLAKLSHLVTTWSIAPPDTDIHTQFDTQTSTVSYPQSDLCGSSFMEINKSFSYIKVEKEGRGGDQAVPPGSFFGRSYKNNCNNGAFGYQIGLNNVPLVGDNGKCYYGMPNISSSTGSTVRNLADVTVPFNTGRRLTKPLIGIHAPNKPCFKSLNHLSHSKNQTPHTSPLGRTNCGSGQGTTELKKKRSEEPSEKTTKKPKQDNSTISPMKAPKAKQSERIAALQQIVSPFGKTDTASVLYEAIGYIKFLQEQLQLLLSSPYLKSSSHKDPWASLDRKEMGDTTIDLRSRGLCLVPISWTPQVYRENTGPDYWTPAYRGCLYR